MVEVEVVGSLGVVGEEVEGSLMVVVEEGEGNHLVGEGKVHFLLEGVDNPVVEEVVVGDNLMVEVVVVVGNHLVVAASVEWQRHRPSQPRE
jgi:hypothetical protein